jgi:ligand-binding sensor domain-containing protein
VYDTENSGLPDNQVRALAFDAQGNLWIGAGGLSKFDGETWTVSLGKSCWCLALDEQGDLWAGTIGGGLLKFDGEHWTVYEDPLESWVYSLAFDAQGNLWIGTISPGIADGLAKFDGETWTVYTPENSGLPADQVLAVAVDERGNKWIGCDGGLAVYREGGVILPGESEVTAIEEKEKAEVPSAFSLSQNHPNPFNPITTITYDLPRFSDVTLTLYTITGQKVGVLVDAYQQPGHHRVFFDGSGLGNGVYLYRLDAGSFVDTKRMLLLK